MAGVSNESARGRWIKLGLALFALNLAVSFRNLWPTPAIWWRGDISVEVAIVLLWLALASRRLGSPSSRVIRLSAVIWVILALGRYADVTARALYGREVNLYWDARHLPAVWSMLVRPAAWWLVLLIAGAAVLIPWFLYAGLHAAFCHVGTAMGRPASRRTIIAMASGVLLLFSVQRIGGVATPPAFSSPATAAYARQARLFFHELTAARRRTVAPPSTLRADLARLRGAPPGGPPQAADVFLVFIESYGAVSYDRPEFAAGLAASRAALAADIRATGRDVVSAFVESPTFGGSSWLAHVSLLSGVEVRDEDTNRLLMAGKRETLVSTFARNGYRTVAMMPGLHQSWPEGAFYGFNELYDEARLDYQGPPFGWWSVPDQFALARLDALEASRPSRPPLFVFYPTTNTHTPFTPTPPYQPDWRRVLTEAPYDEAVLQRAWEQTPDWLDLGPGFVRALAYTYQSLGGYLRLRADRDFVLVLVGDHQPPAAVSGEGASWEVPVHVITSRKDILESLQGRGFTLGLFPRHPALGRMNALLNTLLGAFSWSK